MLKMLIAQYEYIHKVLVMGIKESTIAAEPNEKEL
jgi:hypothetical protein